MKKHKIKLSETEMQCILESVENTAYLGKHSDMISKVRKKMTIKKPKTDIVNIKEQA